MKRALAAAADALVLILTAVILFVIVTGGGVFVLRGQRVSIAGVDNPLIALTMLGALRYVALRRQPVLGVWSVAALETRARLAVARVQRWAESVSPRSAAFTIATAVAAATLVKLVLAWIAPGFFSGDDVEVHEMSLGTLWQARWPIWDLRNALFPLGVVYPLQRLFAAAGADGPATLVFAGRAAVAVISSLTIVLVWRAGLHLWRSAPGWAVVAALLFAAGQLHIAFGSSELPRPVATVLVVGAFVLLLKPGGGRVLSAAVLLGVAASLRFSEAVFLAPAVAMMAWQKRWRAILVLAAIAPVSALGIVAATDAWYWGEPLHSLNAVIDYTLVRRLSSRGYQNPLWYLLNLFAWVSPAIAVLAAIALVGSRRVSDVWLWMPVLLLSVLPHKEARYMIPVVPFACLAAARGLQMIAGTLTVEKRAEPAWQPVALIALMCVGLAHDAGHWRLPRSNVDVAFARQLDATIARDRPVAIQQAWRAGGRLYLHPRDVLDLDPDRLGDPEYLRQTVPPQAAVVVDSGTAIRHGLAETLHSRGYERNPLTVSGSRYRLWTPAIQRATSVPETPRPRAMREGRTPPRQQP